MDRSSDRMGDAAPQLYAVLYVGTSAIPYDQIETDVARVLAAATANNLIDDVTGALIFTAKHFAQILEGPRATLDALIAFMGSDPSHRDVIVLEERKITARSFTGWSLAYTGPSDYVARKIAGAIESASARKPEAISSLRQLVIEFATQR